MFMTMGMRTMITTRMSAVLRSPPWQPALPARPAWIPMPITANLSLSVLSPERPRAISSSVPGSNMIIMTSLKRPADGEKSGIHWTVKAIPEKLCEVTPEDTGDEYKSRYRVTGANAGTAQLIFTAALEDETAVFALTLMAEVDANGEAEIAASSHWERQTESVEADGLNYRWEVDKSGVLHFNFIDGEDRWSVRGDDEEICTILEKLSTSSGCQFSVQAKSTGETTVLLVAKNSQRTIGVVLCADESGNVSVVSVQEQ